VPRIKQQHEVATGRLDDVASALPPNLGRAVKVLPWRLWGRGDDDNDDDDDGGGGGDDGGSNVVLDGDLALSSFKDFHEFASQPAAAGGRSGHRGGGSAAAASWYAARFGAATATSALQLGCTYRSLIMLSRTFWPEIFLVGKGQAGNRGKINCAA
jgi:hypothetical protein